MPRRAAVMILLQDHLHETVCRRCGRSRGQPDRGGEQQRRLLQQWGLQSAPAGQLQPPESMAPKGVVVGEALVLTARELRLVLTLLLVMFMTGEASRYIGALTARGCSSWLTARGCSS